jgi:hypothetical protein
VLFACLILVALLDLCFSEWRVKCDEWNRKKVGEKTHNRMGGRSPSN